jgi:hypothetical protein
LFLCPIPEQTRHSGLPSILINNKKLYISLSLSLRGCRM